MLIIALLATPYIYIFGAVTRLIGSGAVPKIVGKVAFALLAATPFLLIEFVRGGDISYMAWIAAGVFVTSVFLCNPGHADFFYSSTIDRDQSLSPLTALICKLIYGPGVKRQDLRYDYIGMVVTGAVATLPIALGFIAAGHIASGVVVTFGGAFKAYAYRDAFDIDPAKAAKFTETGEWRRGWYAGTAVVLATIICIF